MDMNQITPGSSLSAEIERGLFGCKVFVLCITAEYANSENCIKELELAVALKKPILPILFEDLPWPIQGISFHLSSKIYASFKNAKTADEGVDFWTAAEMAAVIFQIGRYTTIMDSAGASSSTLSSSSFRFPSASEVEVLRDQLKATKEQLGKCEKDKRALEIEVKDLKANYEKEQQKRLALEAEIKSLHAYSQEQQQKRSALETEVKSLRSQIAVLEKDKTTYESTASPLEKTKVKFIDVCDQEIESSSLGIQNNSNNENTEESTNSSWFSFLKKKSSTKTATDFSIFQEFYDSLITGYSANELKVYLTTRDTIILRAAHRELYFKQIIFGHGKAIKYTVKVCNNNSDNILKNYRFFVGWSTSTEKYEGLHNFVENVGILSSTITSERFLTNRKYEVIAFPAFSLQGNTITTSINYKNNTIKWESRNVKFTKTFEDLNFQSNTKLYPALSVLSPDLELEISDIEFRGGLDYV